MTDLKTQANPKLTRIERWGFLWLLVLCAGSLVWRSTPLLLGILLGGFLILINFHFLQSILRKLFNQEQPSSAKWIFLLLGKFLGLIGILVWLIASLKVDVIGLGIGITTLFLALFSESIQSLLKKGSPHGA
ncbi:MAG: hypothetical protein HY538_05920 [Deltaproteobacteria bacterium]|nr:hypothetical protein [Deltaproteobacteria bacterium]